MVSLEANYKLCSLKYRTELLLLLAEVYCKNLHHYKNMFHWPKQIYTSEYLGQLFSNIFHEYLTLGHNIII